MRRENEFRYSKLAGILRDQIYSGYIKPGEFLLSENELCRFYGLSRTSVRKSLEQLVKEGLIVKRAGQGNMVSPDFVVEPDQRKVLRILAPSPSYFVETGFSSLIDAFKSEHPQIEVKLLSLPAVDFWESIRMSAEMGLSPDLVLAADSQLVEADGLEGYMDLAEPLAKEWSAVYPRLQRSFMREGKLKAVPITFSTVYLAYNPLLFEAHGVPQPGSAWSFEDFLSAAETLTMDTNGDGITDQYGFSLSSHFSRWPVFALQNGWKQSDAPEGEIIRRTLKLIHEMIYHKRYAMLYHHAANRLKSNPFVHGKSAMVLTTTFEMAGWKDAKMPFEPKVAPLSLGESNSTLLLANILLIPQTSGDPELAAAFLRTVLRSDVQALMSRTTPFISVHREVNETTRPASFLETINVAGNRMESHFFVDELFDDPGQLEELIVEMEPYWLGLESYESFAGFWENLPQVQDEE